jgi:ABC-type xylose transport system permease subunit
VVSPYFLTTTNLLNIGRAIAIVGIVAVGETIVIIAGGFDLSVGSTMAASGMAAAWLINAGVPLPAAFAVAIAIGVLVGFLNGVIISYGRINPLIATLATLAIVRGLSYVISGGREIVVSDPVFQAFGSGTLLGVLHRHPAGGDLRRLRLADAAPLRPLRLRHRLERQGSAARRVPVKLAHRLRHQRRARRRRGSRLRGADRQRPAERRARHRVRRDHGRDPRRHQPQRRARADLGTFIGLVLLGGSTTA